MNWRLVYAAMLGSMILVLSLFRDLAAQASGPRLALIALLAVMSCYGARKYRMGPASRVLVIGLWLAVGAAGLSTFFSVNPRETLSQTIMLGLLVLIVHGSLHRRWGSVYDVVDDLQVGFWVIAAAAVASLVAAHVIGMPGSMSSAGRLYGIFGNPNMLAMACTPAVFIGIALLRRQASAWRLLAVGAVLMALVQTQSRTAVVAAAIAAVWLLLRVRSGVLIPMVYVIGLVGAVWTWLIWVVRAPLSVPDLAVLDRFTADAPGGELGFRDRIWAASLDVWRDHPIFGTGYGTSQEVLRGAMLGDVTGATSVHSGFVQWLMETGAFGAVILAVPVVAVLRAAILTSRGSIEALLGVSVVAGLALQVGEAGLFGTGQLFPYLFWVTAAGVMVALDRPVEAELDDPAPSTAARKDCLVDR